HAVLRTCFLWEGLPHPVQMVCQQVGLPWSFLDWRDLPEHEQQRSIAALLQQDRERGFDPQTAPLLRLTLVRLGEQSYYFLQSSHHLLLDGWSLPLLLKEVWTFYQGDCEGRESSLPAVRPYRDYIAWLEQQDLIQDERFWRTYLAGFTTPSMLPGHTGASKVVTVQSATEQLACS